MKTAYLVAIFVIAAIAIATTGAFAAENNCYINKQGCTTCTNCQSPAWDRTPVYIQQPNNPFTPPTTPVAAWRVDPWTACGAFCEAGQTPVGWPYGWGDEYWLRPNSNF